MSNGFCAGQVTFEGRAERLGGFRRQVLLPPTAQLTLGLETRPLEVPVLEELQDGGEVVVFADHQPPHRLGVEVGLGQGQQGHREIAVGDVEGLQQVLRQSFLADAVGVVRKRRYFGLKLPEIW